MALSAVPGFVSDLPQALRESGPYGLPVWQWLAIPSAIAVAWLIGLVLSRITRAIGLKIAKRTPVLWDEELAARLGGALTLAWTKAALDLLIPWLDLPKRTAEFAERSAEALLLIAIFWALWKIVELSRIVVSRSAWAAATPSSRSLLILTARVAKVVVAAFALVVVLAHFGYPVASLIAGLGVGGIAIALAAQKTVENLFGAFSIGVDQPFREGDFIRVDNVMGTVEAMGLRSTRLRTPERTLISIPNGKLAEMRIETFAARDRIRFSAVIGLIYGTSAEQLRRIMDDFERRLLSHPKIVREDVSVRLIAFGQAALEVEVICAFATVDYGEFTHIRQDLLLDFMKIVESAGSAFAQPTRIIHVESAKS